MVKLTVSKDDVEAFCNTCVLLRSLWRHYEIWLEGSELPQSIAPIFFGDIHALFVRTLILEICKITDPAETMGRTNLTVKFLMSNSDFSSAPNTLDKLKRFSDSMHAFRDKIVPARNRLIMYKHYVDPNSHFYLNGIAQSDAEMLVKALKESA